MTQLTKSSSSEEIKQYFNAILKLSKSSEEFPVNLDEVWPLVYGRKEESVRSLISDTQFMEGVDFQVLRRNAEQKSGSGGHNRIDYKLSVPCLEFFIARKVRDVFEVYRQVFHKSAKVIENKEKSVSPRTLQLMKLDTAKWLMKNLDYNEVSKLELARALADPLKLPTPDYVKAEDNCVAPTHLLVARGYKEGFTKTFNLIMQKAGLLERKTRPSSSGSGGIRKFWKLTEEGLAYGENQKAPENPRSMQPLYFESKFDELLERLGINTKKTEG